MKARQRVSALRGGQPEDLVDCGLRNNFVAGRLDETENRTRQTGYPGKVGSNKRLRG